MNILKHLPKIDKLLFAKEFEGLNKTLLADIARGYIAFLRQEIIKKNVSSFSEIDIIQEILKSYQEKTSSSLKPLINATGVVIHTNLGRSPLHVDIYDRAKEIACGYSNLEFDLQTGKRGQRYSHVSKQLCTLLGVEDALLVNNNAAAVFLVLNTFGKDKKTVLSRGELVEIGGSFRIPEVMKESGTKLKEVGTTNKTKIQDYENAIGKKTAVLMKVHKSNFTQKGFCEETPYEQIVALAKEKNLIDYYDVGGAYIDELSPLIKDDELDLKRILKCDPSLVSFSGDKLLGSVQCGIIVGKKHLIKKLKQNQLLRMLRVDKVTLALLEVSISAYIENKTNLIPTLELLKRSEEELKQMCLHVKEHFSTCEMISTSSYVGGGTMPDKLLPSQGLHVKGDAKEMQKLFRENGIIGRISQEKFILDFRSILQKDLPSLIEKMGNIL